MTETQLWQTVKNARAMSDTHMCRVENAAGIGIPDCTFAHGGTEVWVELKVFRSGRLHFRTSQGDWIARRSAAGGRVVVLARDGDTLSLWNPLELFNLHHRVEDPGKSFSVRPEAPFVTQGLIFATKKPFDWAELKGRLFNPALWGI